MPASTTVLMQCVSGVEPRLMAQKWTQSQDATGRILTASGDLFGQVGFWGTQALRGRLADPVVSWGDDQ